MVACRGVPWLGSVCVSFSQGAEGYEPKESLTDLGGVSTMVFGMCATRVINLVVTFMKDVIEVRSQRMNGPVSSGPRFEEITSEGSKKTL